MEGTGHSSPYSIDILLIHFNRYIATMSKEKKLEWPITLY